MRGSRVVSVVAVVAALALGRAITSAADMSDKDFDPFYEEGRLGEPVHLVYADLSVTDVRPAQYVAPQSSDDLAALAGGVWVLVSIEATAKREPTRLETPILRDDEDRVVRASPKSQCPTGATLATGLPTYTMFCFDVPPDRLAGLRLEVSRGTRDSGDTIRGDHVASVDLEVSTADEKAWAGTTDVFGAQAQSYEPLELEPITLGEVEPGEESP